MLNFASLVAVASILLGPAVAIVVAHSENTGALGYVACGFLGLMAGVAGSFCSLKLEDVACRRARHSAHTADFLEFALGILAGMGSLALALALSVVLAWVTLRFLG